MFSFEIFDLFPYPKIVYLFSNDDGMLYNDYQSLIKLLFFLIKSFLFWKRV